MKFQLGAGRRSALAASVFALAATVASAQVVPQVIPLGGGCGSPKPSINSTLPLLTQNLTVFITGMTPGCPVTLFITPPPAAPFPFGANNECSAWIDLSLVASLAPPYVWTGVADGRGNYSTTFPTIDLLGFAPGAPCNMQAVCTMPPGTSGAADFFGYSGFVTDGITIIMGDTPPGDPPSDVPPSTCCTYTRQQYGDCGPAGDIFWDNFADCFPNGLITGVYSPGGNYCYSSNSAPNGKKFTTSCNGTYALWDYLYFNSGSCSSNAYYSADQINSSSSNGAGNFGREAAGLAVNIGFSDCDVIGDNCLFGDLVYVKAGDSLNGATVRQILAAANNALAGLGYPAGYTNSSFRTLLINLNCAYINCVASTWAGQYLYQPNAN